MAIDDARAALPTAGSLVRLDWRSARVTRVSRRVSDTGPIGVPVGPKNPEGPAYELWARAVGTVANIATATKTIFNIVVLQSFDPQRGHLKVSAI